MIVTEEEAKDKLCRIARYAPVEVKCAGSMCMHWRAFDQSLRPGAAVGDDNAVIVRGFCGLAGPVTAKTRWVR